MSLPPAMTLSIAAVTHRGHVREHNEDTVAIGSGLLPSNMKSPFTTTISTPQYHVMIADGIGGHAKGAVASRTTLQTLSTPSLEASNSQQIQAAIHSANQALYDQMDRDPSAKGMGTTLVGALLRKDGLIVFNVGDSRAYLSNAHELMQLSTDDVPPATIGVSSRKSHIVTQCLGGPTRSKDMIPHIAQYAPLKTTEQLLLCSDGLTDMVSDDVIHTTLNTHIDVSVAVGILLDSALRAGGHDNVSIVLARPGLAGTSRHIH